MSWLWIGLVIALVQVGLALMATTVYLHRGKAHQAVTFAAPAEFGFRILVWLFGSVRVREWVGVHRLHHTHTDEPGDPHSPYLEGFWPVFFGNAFLYRRAAQDPEVIARYAPDLPPDRWDRWFFDRTIPGKVAMTIVLALFVGIPAALLGTLLGSLLYVMGGSVVNSLGHRVGTRPHANTATNHRFLALFTVGESLHNNHHERPSRARFSERAGEIDLGWWVINALRFFRLASVR